jgi:monoamine oxidase
MIFDSIIVGGGISGLYTNLELYKREHKTLLLESSSRYGGRIYQYEDKDISVPAGATRFNRNHKRVIKLLKRFNLLDFRKDSGMSSNIDFIDSKRQFHPKYENKTGFEYIKRILRNVEKRRHGDILRNYTFQEYALSCLTKSDVDFLLIASGYSGQLKHMNMFDAYHLFKYGIRDDVTFYSGYFQDLISSIVQQLKDNGSKLLLNSRVTDVAFDDVKDCYLVHYNNIARRTKRVIFALPQPALLKIKLLNPIHSLLRNTITCKSLCRVYAKFKPQDIWFRDINKTVTNNALRYIIPMDREKGTIIISYTDDIYCEYWKTRQNNQTKLKKSVVDLVKMTFNKSIAEPEKVWVFYWDCGVGYWNKGVNSTQIANFLANPMENVYICGENYSLEQSWVEGALESCERVLKII